MMKQRKENPSREKTKNKREKPGKNAMCEMTSFKNLIFLLFAWHIFVISSFRLPLFNLFVFRVAFIFCLLRGVISSLWRAIKPGAKTKSEKKPLEKTKKCHTNGRKKQQQKTLPEKNEITPDEKTK